MYSAIWCQSRNGVIGRDGAMPWHEPADLAHFRRVTHGGIVIMGRRTWESLPGPLPGRTPVVVTSRALPVTTAPDLATALEQATGPAWVIGGTRLLAEAVADHRCEQLVVTRLDHDVDGDTYAPPIPREWTLATKAGPFETWTRDPRV